MPQERTIQVSARKFNNNSGLNYKQLEQKRIRSLSKKRQAKKQKRNKSIIQAGLSYVGIDMSMTPIPGRNQPMNHTFSNDMKRALGRKLNPVPRRQDIIYDLNGRPVYIGNSTADQSSPRIKNKLANQGDMLAYHAASNMHPLMEQDVSNQTLLSQIQNKKNIKAMNLRTDFSIAPISHGKRKASVQVPKLNHFSVIKNISPRRLDPENSARMDEKTKASLQMSAHVTDLSSITVPDLNPKSERPIAASEK